jgi:hypothetical protein
MQPVPRFPASPFLAALWAATLSLGLAGPCAAAADAASFGAASAGFSRAVDGDEAAIAPAAEEWARLSAADPVDPVLRAYAGAATALRARTTLLPWKKMSLTEDGLALIDKALAQLTPAHDAPLYRGVPASLETRYTAASTFLALPALFNRQARGAKLLDEVIRSPLFAAAPAPFKATVWLQAARLKAL